MHYFETNCFGQRLSLCGSVITFYDVDGRKLNQWFYTTKHQALKVFKAVVGKTIL